MNQWPAWRWRRKLGREAGWGWRWRAGWAFLASLNVLPLSLYYSLWQLYAVLTLLAYAFYPPCGQKRKEEGGDRADGGQAWGGILDSGVGGTGGWGLDVCLALLPPSMLLPIIYTPFLFSGKESCIWFCANECVPVRVCMCSCTLITERKKDIILPYPNLA